MLQDLLKRKKEVKGRMLLLSSERAKANYAIDQLESVGKAKLLGRQQKSIANIKDVN